MVDMNLPHVHHAQIVTPNSLDFFKLTVLSQAFYLNVIF